ncbi:MAG: serine acetyltransferase [Armatimonadetes bacterium]|nr:serine acetyltransferase [Armatimonadota bacterium]
MLDNVKADIARYTEATGTHWLRYVLTQQGAWATIEYRYSHWVRHHCKYKILQILLKYFGWFWHKAVQLSTGINIDSDAEIGKGLFIAHFGCIFIAGQVKMGERCNINQGVTLGWSGRGDNKGCPILGDRVYVGAGAKVVGKVTVGSDVAIGANAVVTKDVPDNAVVGGIPARIINYNGSSDFIEWRD